MKVSLSGKYKIKVTDKDGKVKVETDWFDNLITNQGLDWWGTPPTGYNSVLNQFCCVGTGNTTPAFTDTVLAAALTPAAVIVSTTQTYVAGPPSYWSNIYTYTWSQGAIVGNIAEIGVGGLASSTPPYTGVVALYSRALIVDGGGAPTTIPVTSTDTLSCSYENRLYINTTDTNYSLAVGGVTYSGIYRFMDITHPTFQPQTVTAGSGYISIRYYNGTIGTITQVPSGSTIGGNTSQGVSITLGTYTIGSYSIGITATIPANSQAAINITAIGFTTQLGKWQFSVSPAWPRATYQIITTGWQLSWGRY